MQAPPNLFPQTGLVPPGFQQPFGQPQGQPIQQQIAQPAAPQNGQHAEEGEDSNEPTKLEIIPSSTGESFFVVGASGNDELKKRIKSLGGHYNHRVRGWKFHVSKQTEVCTALGMASNVDLVDPRKVVTVEFTQKLQWPGDMTVIEQKMKDLGLTKKAGKTNTYVGDLSKAPGFLQSFQFQ
jgi:hypothetical protein